MADQDYTLRWNIDPGAAVSGASQITAALLALEAVIDRVGPKLQNIALGASTGMGGASRSATGLTARLAALQAQATATGPALAGLSGQVGGIGRAASTSEGRVVGFGAAMIALHLGERAIGALTRQTEELAEKWKKMAEDADKFRDNLRELANIKGETAPSNELFAATLQAAQAMNMEPEKAREFLQSYENIGPTVRAKQHFGADKAKADALEKDVLAEAGKTAVRVGLDEKAAGELMGGIGLQHTLKDTEDAMGHLGGTLWGLSTGKLEYTAGVRALNKAMAKLVDPKETADEGAMPGKIRSAEEAGVYLGALSLGTGTAEQAGHRMVQMSRVLNPPSANKPAAEALQKAGITKDMDDPQKMIALAKYLKKEKVGDVKAWLEDHKLGTVATREGAVAALKVADVLEERIAEVNQPGQGKKTIEQNRAFEKSRVGITRKIATTKAVLDKAEGDAVGEFEAANKLAEERMRLFDPRYRSPLLRAQKGASSIITFFSHGKGGAEAALEDAPGLGSIPTLRKAAAGVGTDVDARFPGLGSTNQETRARAFSAASKAVRDKGGDPLDLIRTERATAAKIQRNAPPPAAPGAPGVKAPGHAMNQGGGALGPGIERQLGQLVALTEKQNQMLGQRGGMMPGSGDGGATAGRA